MNIKPVRLIEIVLQDKFPLTLSEVNFYISFYELENNFNKIKKIEGNSL